MSCTTSKVRTALVFNNPEDSLFDRSLFIFKVAFSFAKKGISPFIITNGPWKEMAEEVSQFSLYPEVLSRITFRYLTSSQEVIRWCHEIYYLHNKPILLLISLDHYSRSDKFEIIRLCAALIDALNYISVCYKSKETYLLANSTIKLDHLPQLHSFFHLSWLYSKIKSHIILKPYDNDEKENVSQQVKISSSSCFEDVSKIFIG